MADAIILEITGPDIKGECQLDGFKDMITLESFSHGLNQPMTMDPANQARTVGRVNCQDLSISKFADNATVELINSINTSKNHTSVKLHLLKAIGDAAAGQKEVMTITMDNTMFSSYSLSGGGGGPMEALTLNFTKITWAYKAQSTTGATPGNVTTNWNLALGKKE